MAKPTAKPKAHSSVHSSAPSSTQATRKIKKPTPKPAVSLKRNFAYSRKLIPLIVVSCGALVGWVGLKTTTHSRVTSFQNPCLTQFFSGAAPELTNVKLKAQSYPLCYGGFNLTYSGVSRTPLWVAEHLTFERVSTKIKREDNFHEETRLPEDIRSRLEDYRGSGFDRGHMAPNGDMSDKSTQYDSFSLANIVPQTPENNQNTWREIEESVRTMTGRYKTDVYVVTGPAFLSSTVRYIKKGHPVLVPSHLYKAIYIPELGIASAYLSPNDQSFSAQIVSICALEEKVGINIFPRVSEQLKRQVYNLPLRANQVKANRTPQQIDTDNSSQCAASIRDEQIQATAQQFISPTGRPTSEDRASSTNTTIQHNESNPQSQSSTQEMNKILIPIFKWIKNQ